MRIAILAVVAALTAIVPSARTASPALPPAMFTVPGQLAGLAASGFRIAVAGAAEEGCGVYTARLVAGREASPVRVRAGALPCATEFDAQVYDVWIGRGVVGAAVINSPSPHGDSYSNWQGSLPSGPLREYGPEYGWFDSSTPYAYGCVRKLVTGGGVVAATDDPNRFGVDAGVDKKVACPGDGTTEVELTGAARRRVSVAGSWTVLATDGKRLVLSRLDPVGLPTGELEYVDLAGKALATPRVDPAVVKAAYRGWLAPEGLVLLTKGGLIALRWRVPDVVDATVAYGRVFYVRRRTVRVRRIRDGRDRPLVAVPRASQQPLAAAGSFGLAVAAEIPGPNRDSYRTGVYRIGWSTIDAILPAR